MQKISKDIWTLYLAERAKGSPARWALLYARTRQAWDHLNGFMCNCYSDRDAAKGPGETIYAPGPIRLKLEPDESYTLYDLAGDTYNRAANPDIQESLMAREEQAFIDRVNRDGVHGLIGEFWNGNEWEHADSCFGFVGDDWKDSSYDCDIMASTIDAYQSHLKTLAREWEASRPDMYP